LAHLVDGIKIQYKDDIVTIYDGENKPIIYSGKTVDKNILENFIWLYKINIEHYDGDWEGMFFDDYSYKESMKNT
jgi:hypothetical protein